MGRTRAQAVARYRGQRLVRYAAVIAAAQRGRLVPRAQTEAGALSRRSARQHHLFPRVPHTHYAQIAMIVRRNAELHGVRYVSQPSLSHFRHLRTMGRLGIPVAPEMG